jgi:hypothetical protein
MKNLKISTKLIILVSMLSVVTIFIGVYGILNLGEANRGLETVYLDRVIPLEEIKHISDAYAITVPKAAHKVMSGEKSWWWANKELEKAEDVIQDNWDKYLATYMVAEEKRLVNEVRPLMEDGHLTISLLSNIVSQQDSARLQEFIVNELYPSVDALHSKLDQLSLLQLDVAKAEFEKEEALYESTFRNSIIIMAIGILFAILLSIFIIYSINKSIQGAINVVQKLAKGIMDAQRKEIKEMEWLIKDIRKNGIAETEEEAKSRAVPKFAPTPE